MSGGSGPVVIDLFCGAGGLSEGLRQAGFKPVVGVDFDKHASATYRHNHPGVPVIEGSVEYVTGEQLIELAGTADIDLIAGGPSCQGFSTHGKRMQDDPRNFLFKHFVRLVDEVRPKMFLMENVRGMLTYGKGAFRRQIEAAFAEIGYRTDFAQVLAADYGVPQMRHRILFIGTRIDDIRLSFPEPTHGDPRLGLKPYVTVEEAIGDLPLMGRIIAMRPALTRMRRKTPFKSIAAPERQRKSQCMSAGHCRNRRTRWPSISCRAKA